MLRPPKISRFDFLNAGCEAVDWNQGQGAVSGFCARGNEPQG
jgi:hypothetical protein